MGATTWKNTHFSLKISLFEIFHFLSQMFSTNINQYFSVFLLSFSWSSFWWLWLVTKSCPTLVIPWTVTCWAPLCMEFSRQESWIGLPFPSPGDLPDPGIELRSPTLQADSLPTELRRKPLKFIISLKKKKKIALKIHTSFSQCFIG